MDSVNQPTLDVLVERFCQLYRKRILPQHTRSVPLLGRKCSPQVLYTFLGFELKLGRKRITCPDMTTARYLSIFAELGLVEVEIPYDPSQAANLLPELERHFFQIKEVLVAAGYPKRRHQRELRAIYARIRNELTS